MSSSGDPGDALASSLVGLVIIVLIVATIVAIWLAVRIANCLIVAFAISPRCKALWITAGISVLLFALGKLTGASWLYIGSAASFAILVVCAQAVRLTNDPLYQPEPSREQFVDEVLHINTWWPQAA